jgi:hypothetical protein
MGASSTDNSTLQSQIQTALQNDPTLRSDTINVNVTETAIELSGNVPTGKEKQTANRIASSFAGNRRVRDRVTVSGRGSASSNSPGSSDMNSNPAGTSSNPNSSSPKSNSNDNTTNKNPASSGDASSNPR